MDIGIGIWEQLEILGLVVMTHWGSERSDHEHWFLYFSNRS